MMIAGVGTEYNVGTGCWLPRDRVYCCQQVLALKRPDIMLTVGVGFLGTGYNVGGGCWLSRDRV